MYCTNEQARVLMSWAQLIHINGQIVVYGIVMLCQRDPVSVIQPFKSISGEAL